MLTIDLSLNNEVLYAGCTIETVAGRKNLTTPVAEAVNLVGENAERLVAELPTAQRDVVVLTGPMAVWAYLVVFHTVVHRFREVQYDDGRNGPVTLAKHG